MRDAKQFLHSGNFLKKGDLEKDGPLRFTVAEVAESEGKSWDGKPPESELQLVTTEGTRISLRTAENLRRMIKFFGNDLDTWVGVEVEAYFSPDIPNPKNPSDAGGIRLRLPTVETVPQEEWVSDLEEEEPSPPPPAKGNGRPSKARMRAER